MANDTIPSPTPFNPLDKRHLGESVAAAMLKSDIHPLPPEKFRGAGIYAIYYIGDFEAYADLAVINRDGQFARPIYVGKAVPAMIRGIVELCRKPFDKRKGVGV